MNKKLITFFLLFGLFLVLNPFKNVYAYSPPPVHTLPSIYYENKANYNGYIEVIGQWIGDSDKWWDYYLYDFTKINETGATFSIGQDSTGVYIQNSTKTTFSVQGGTVRVFADGSNNGFGGFGNVTTDKLYIHGKNDVRFDKQFLTYSGIKFIDGTYENSILDGYAPPPPSIDEEDNFGYEFEYPKNKEVINLHNTSGSSYLKVPYKIKVKNFYAMPPKKVQENFTNSFKINNYKTEVNNFVWQIKSDILGMADYSIFTVEGNYYIPTSINKDILNAYIENPSEPWVNGQVNVTYTFDGSAPSYKPIDNNSSGEITDDGNVVIGDTDYGGIPQAPSEDGSIGDWFAYVGSLLLWLVTYPFKLLGQIVSTLTGYITNMFGILTPVTAQLNNVLSFIPSDILNVCWGFLSFTVLYSVLKSVFKMIRG